MPTLIAEEPIPGLQLRWVHPKVIEFIEALPRYGEGRITIVEGRPTSSFAIAETFLYTAGKPRRDGDRGQ
jgi:hypothetical protein